MGGAGLGSTFAEGGNRSLVEAKAGEGRKWISFTPSFTSHICSFKDMMDSKDNQHIHARSPPMKTGIQGGTFINGKKTLVAVS